VRAILEKPSAAQPPMDKLILISELFNISLDELVKGTDASDVDSKDVDTTETKLDKPKKGFYDIFLLLVKIFGVVLLIDVFTMIIYFISSGFPS